MNDTTNNSSTATTILNYIMNRYMPFVCVAFLLFCTLGFSTWPSYLIIGFMWFATSYSFNCGIAHVLCEVDYVPVTMNESSTEEKTDEDGIL
jgi:hypothetical protein